MKEKTVQYYPVFLNLTGKKCVVVGGGKVAERKVRQLLKAGARIAVISPEITRGLERLITAGKVSYKKRVYRSGDVKGAFLVIVATSDEEMNRKIALEADGLVNAIDRPDLCGFIAPSVVNRGALTIAISTSGASPSLAKTLRKEIEHMTPADIGKYLELMRKIRPLILKSFSGSSKEQMKKKEELLQELGSREMLDMLRQKGFQYTRSHVENLMRESLERL